MRGDKWRRRGHRGLHVFGHHIFKRFLWRRLRFRLWAQDHVLLLHRDGERMSPSVDRGERDKFEFRMRTAKCWRLKMWFGTRSATGCCETIVVMNRPQRVLM